MARMPKPAAPRYRTTNWSEYNASLTTGIHKPGDSVALIQSRSLAKLQMRRVIDGDFHRIFVTREEAQTWLDARRRAQLGPASVQAQTSA